jgi:predicted aspartyl protease
MIAPMRCSSRAIRYSQSRFRFFIVLGCLGLFGLGALLAKPRSPMTLAVLARDGYGVVPISRPRPNDLIVRGTINGQKATLILDTGWGAPGVSLGTPYAKSLKLAMTGGRGIGESSSGVRTAAEIAAPGTVMLGDVQLTDVPLIVGGFGMLRSSINVADAQGFVGVQFLSAASAILDLPNFCLYLRPPHRGRLANLGPALKAVGLSEIPFVRLSHGHCVVDALVNGVPGKMVIDTGATLTGLDTRFASRMKIRGRESPIRTIDAAGVAEQRRVAQMASLTIGGVPIRAPELTIGTYSFYTESGGQLIGVLGMDVLGQNWGIIDFGNRKLYLAKAR